MGAGRGKTCPPAFTLVELLVVVSIVGLLAAALAAPLRRARENAKRTVCAAQQHQIVIASETYSLDYGALPIMNRDGLDINYRKVSSQWRRQDVAGFGPETWDVYTHQDNFWTGSPFRGIIFQVDISRSMSEFNFGLWRNFGLLYMEKAVTDPKGFFCPSQREPRYAWSTPLNPWPPRLETARRPDVPRWANHTQSGFERRLGLTGVPWDRISPQTAIVTDRLVRTIDAYAAEDPSVIVGGRDDMSIVKDTHRTGINVAYRDGHVTFIRDQRLFDWLPADSTFYESRLEALALYDWLDQQFWR